MPRAAFVLVCLVLWNLALPGATRADWPSDPCANLPVCTATGDQYFPVLVPDGAGGAIVVWVDHRAGYHSDVYAQRLNAAGSALWATDGVPVVAVAGSQQNVQAVTDGAGGAIVQWIDHAQGSSDIIAQRIGPGGARMWPAAGVAVRRGRYADYEDMAALTSDGDGGAFVAWTEFYPETSVVFVQHLDASGALVWGTVGVAAQVSAASHTRPQVVADGSGGAIVVWMDERHGPAQDVYAQRVNAAGDLLWGASGAGVCTAAGDQRDAVLLADGAGGAFFAWQDVRSDLYGDIYAQRLDGTGVARWTTDGVAVCAAPGLQAVPQLIADGAGGAIVAWFGLDASSDLSCWAQRLSGGGAPRWTAAGVPLCTVAGVVDTDLDFFYPTLISDGANGMIATWWDRRSGVHDVYVQRVTAAGTLAWTSNGIAVCTAPGDQLVPTLIGDGAGGAIVAWQDARSGDWDIWAQHLDAAGHLGTDPADVSSPATATLGLGAPTPNPSAGRTHIPFALPHETRVRLTILDVGGREVRRLVDGLVPAGRTMTAWDGRDDAGRAVESGVYFVRLATGDRVLTTRLVSLR